MRDQLSATDTERTGCKLLAHVVCRKPLIHLKIYHSVNVND